MRTSLATNEIQDALAKFHLEMTPVNRDKSVSMKGTSKSGSEYSVKYDYAPLEAIQEQARPLLSKNGLSVVQMLGHLIVDSKLTPIITTRVCHSSGQFLESDWPIDLAGISKEQDRGSKLTYNKRYAYTAALDIILENEDNDAQGVPLSSSKPQTKPTEQQKPKPVPQDFTGDLKDFVMPCGNKNVKGKKLSDIDQKDLLDCIDFFTDKRKKEPTGTVAVPIKNAIKYLSDSIPF